MEKKKLIKLMNRITVRNYVNLHGDDKAIDVNILNDLIKQIHDMHSASYCVTVDINNFKRKDEKEETEQLKNIINNEMVKKQFPHWIHKASFIDGLLHQLNERLEEPALIIFHQFSSPEDDKEKDWLRSIRQFIQMRNSLLLRLLLISSKKLGEWELRPYSDMDERAIEYFPYDNTLK